MFKKSSWLHLRIPFSFFLLPVFLFALSISPNIKESNLLIVFLSLHFFLYPASNGYNSYFDKDEKSIGGLKNPPKVSKGLYYLALVFDIIAILLGLYISWPLAIMLFVYGLVSKAYSHPSIRLKKYPLLSWFIAGLFQGAFTLVMAYMGLNGFGFNVFLLPQVVIPAILSSLILWGSYPMTQIYQHEEDAKRGDNTLSLKLGIKGTFYFTAAAFSVAVAAFVFYFMEYQQIKYAWIFVGSMFPVVMYFAFWYLRVHQDSAKADYKHTMWLNMISAICLSAFFIYFFIDRTQILQAIKGF
ncbi:UbiA family prenyltransferase [Fulvivirga maritima]|uniref:UbiA family prenyltransferase n=1 Tax=Fulvivirga maritima TaxID=2904247 RepID=UPI001F3B3CE2|nr:UbiA family prenyltransferase [Fulvivirga maritima]UII28097.1 UbiA family prenyltransferase [Fulvivirga maritima]